MQYILSIIIYLCPVCIMLHVKVMSSVTEEKLHAVGAGWYLQTQRGGFGFGMC